jgi:heme oxygenase (mycobilin-producing)
MATLTIDLDQHPNRSFRIDAFAVPEAARSEFEAAMRRNLAFLNTVAGFLGHVVFEKASGPSAFNIVTVAGWESREALENAGTQVRAYYQSIGFDPPAELSRWGVSAELGNYNAPPRLQ